MPFIKPGSNCSDYDINMKRLKSRCKSAWQLYAQSSFSPGGDTRTMNTDAENGFSAFPAVCLEWRYFSPTAFTLLQIAVHIRFLFVMFRFLIWRSLRFLFASFKNTISFFVCFLTLPIQLDRTWFSVCATLPVVEKAAAQTNPSFKCWSSLFFH